MKKLPLTNFDKFEKKHWTDRTPNCELFWCGRVATHHYQYKNYQEEGIEIEWKGNPFGLDYKFDYILKK